MENDSERWPTAGSSLSDIPPISPKQCSRRVENASTDTVDSGPSSINEPRRYNIRKGKEGLFVIFNHKIFDIDLPLRKGTDTDKTGLKEVWEDLGFHVVVHEDLKYTQICEKIKKYSSETYHDDYDCFALAVLTHGGDKDTIYAKDKSYHAGELFEPFRDCKSLTGKPKLFFIQACRGRELDHGVKRVECDAVDAAATPSDDNVEVTIPRESDFLIAYSTVEGYYSWRHLTDGSWFIGNLNKCMKMYAPKWDLMTILTEVNREVSTRESSSDLENFKGKKQCPSIVSRLTSLVYFTRKNKSEQRMTTDCQQEATMNPPLLTSESSVFERENSGSTQDEYYRLKMEVLGKKKELIELEQKLCQAKMQKVKFDC